MTVLNRKINNYYVFSFIIIKGSKSMDDGSLLAETLKTHGLYLQSGENPHLLNTDQAVFLKVDSFLKLIILILEWLVRG